MINQLAERTIARVLGIGSALVAIVVVTGTVTDPVNVTKLFVLGGVASAALAVLLAFGLQELWSTSKALIILGCIFLLAGLNAIFNSDAPLTQNLYGAYGRNTAFITYLLLVSVILSVAVVRRDTSFKYLIWGLLGAGLVNVLYCGWVIFFGDLLRFFPIGIHHPNIIGACCITGKGYFLSVWTKSRLHLIGLSRSQAQCSST